MKQAKRVLKDGLFSFVGSLSTGWRHKFLFGNVGKVIFLCVNFTGDGYLETVDSNFIVLAVIRKEELSSCIRSFRATVTVASGIYPLDSPVGGR